MEINTVGIIGLGLIGGSIAKAFKNKFGVKVCALSRSLEPLEAANNDGVVDKYSDYDMSIFSECDLIFLCTPVDKITSYVDKLIPYIKKTCILTDVGSTKDTIYNKMMKYINNDLVFIGGHPMAGSEKTGYSAAKDTLFENAFYVLTPLPNVAESTISIFSSMLKTIGAIPVVLPSEFHDRAVAAVSHVPHIIASALVNMVYNIDGQEHYMHTLAAGGFKDITRIASSSPEMWSSICIENKSEILTIIENFKNVLSDFEKYLFDKNKNEIYDFFDSAKEYRDTFAENKTASIPRTHDIFVDVCDRPGIIATIATLLSVNNINIKNIGIINNREYQSGVLQIAFDTYEEKEQSIPLLEEMNFTVYIPN